MVRAGVCVGVMEGIERPLRRHKDRERLVGVGFPHLDPQHRRSCRQSSRTRVPLDERSANSRTGGCRSGASIGLTCVVRVDITPKGDP